MGAVETARRILDWVARPTGLVPNGTLWESSELAAPGQAVLDRLRSVTRTANALAGAGDPPFGDAAPVGLGAVLLAAAIGGREQADHAERIARASTPPRDAGGAPGWHDLSARNAVLLPVLRASPRWRTDGALVQSLLHASPLTAVLHHPPGGAAAERNYPAAERTAETLLEAPRGREVLVAALAADSRVPDVLAWRAHLLNLWLRHGRTDLVLDTYALARLRYGERWDEQIGAALNWHGRPDPVMTGTARYWTAAERVPLRLRRPVARGHERALTLVRRHRNWTGGTG
ncbi:hypothetical protein AGRA3207_000877 [Actinomadura graeca]|uniref:FtsH ternary system domain-containing protein n=1 Tax=Actinomadura graeca TaxID=2750812 RepID=A0ABX8QNQ8_9ACTN|nr:hypothetical protein [Actinomadura graeca]QXJ20205.1 hypothetical protein AGRA3207_000877 [Actinomadura graeca]